MRAGKVRGRCNLQSVLAKGLHHGAPQEALPGTSLPFERNRDLGRLVRVLERPGHPLDDVLVVRAGEVFDVGAEEGPVALDRLDREAAP